MEFYKSSSAVEKVKKEFLPRFQELAPNVAGIQVSSLVDVGGYYIRVMGEEELYTPIITGIKMESFGGNCGICIARGLNTHTKYRNKGFGSLLFELATELARQCGYSLLMCTDVAYAVFVGKIMDKFDAVKVHNFSNKRSLNRCDVFVVSL